MKSSDIQCCHSGFIITIIIIICLKHASYRPTRAPNHHPHCLTLTLKLCRWLKLCWRWREAACHTVNRYHTKYFSILYKISDYIYHRKPSGNLWCRFYFLQAQPFKHILIVKGGFRGRSTIWGILREYFHFVPLYLPYCTFYSTAFNWQLLVTFHIKVFIQNIWWGHETWCIITDYPTNNA